MRQTRESLSGFPWIGRGDEFLDERQAMFHGFILKINERKLRRLSHQLSVPKSKSSAFRICPMKSDTHARQNAAIAIRARREDRGRPGHAGLFREARPG